MLRERLRGMWAGILEDRFSKMRRVSVFFLSTFSAFCSGITCACLKAQSCDESCEECCKECCEIRLPCKYILEIFSSDDPGVLDGSKF